MNTQPTPAANSGAANELFALTDEQILDIAEEPVILSEAKNPSSTQSDNVMEQPKRDSSVAPLPQNDSLRAATRESPNTSYQSPVTHNSAEPPPWLAAQMKDPWTGSEAQEFWNGVQQARSEAAAYRSAIATPEDARALKELYPGGVGEARMVAERARQLDEIDRAYFGGAGNSPEQTSAARVQLAQRLLGDDPAAFREMVELGLRMLQQPTEIASSRVAAQHVAPQLGLPAQAGTTSAVEAQVAAYAAFERAANEDLERSVGAAIERTLQQALPAVAPHNSPGQAGAQHVAPLQQKLGTAIREDVERALQGDRQLSEQVAQILASRRFDTDSRAQVVRVIGERAQQLVPGAAKRVLNEWTQTTLAAHRARSQRGDASAATVDVSPASPGSPGEPPSPARLANNPRRLEASATKGTRRVDYRKLSDEQILDM